MKRILIISPPRSGSSLVSQLLESAGYQQPKLPLSAELLTGISPSEFNPRGYNEDTAFSLLNDQLIRLIYGHRYSFLHSPSPSAILTAVKTGAAPTGRMLDDFYYDLDEATVVMPRDYLSRLKDIANHSWDVWGLSRMQISGKWYKAYSRHNLASGNDIDKKLLEFRNFLQNRFTGPNTYLKDPRVIFAFPAYLKALAKSEFSVILLHRDTSDLLKSMRAHYGNRLFTEHVVDDHKFVSNHFNYQVRPQVFDDYLASARLSMKIIRDLGLPVLELSYDKLKNADHRHEQLSSLNSFIEADVDHSIIHSPSRSDIA